ncbi:lactosylceramide 4-alpha-galactosyltransferase-like [Macrobrachium rosenbergii]|uniref:lactosylceramide 4-alpha-galactosyltransferase-like n=1 Tax=Macrobrachium rosenbergii TaxID=79674 RepID=UPI0034D3B5EC
MGEEHQSVFMSDASRAEILRKYGGTYMDMDFLTLRPLPNRTNYLGRIDSETVNGAIMSLVKGHPLRQILAKSVPEAFDPFQANSIGPSLGHLCPEELCPGNLTSNTYSRRLSNASNDDEAYSLHLYNSLTWMEELTPGGDSIIEEAMKRNCPGSIIT